MGMLVKVTMKSMPLSTPGLALEMLIENEGSGLVVLCSKVAVG